MNNPNKTLIFGGVLSILVSLLHIAIIVGGPSWYLFFGAGEEMATMAEQGLWIPGIVTFVIAVIFFLWGLYAFSGAGIIKRFPFIKVALVIISLIYLIRGLGILPAIIFMPETVDSLLIWSSLISLIIGLAYAIGTKQVWSTLSANSDKTQ